MAPRYNLFFVPHPEDRKRISPLRRDICRQVHSTQALQYPVHMTLVSRGFSAGDFPSFERDLRSICRGQKRMVLRAEGMTSVLPDRFWTGIHIIKTGGITRLQLKLQELRNKYADKSEREKHPLHPPHITLAFPAKVEGLREVECPVKHMRFDRVTIVKKERMLAPYRIYKHIKFAGS